MIFLIHQNNGNIRCRDYGVTMVFFLCISTFAVV